MAALVAYLASAESKFVTGQVYTIDGGRMTQLSYQADSVALLFIESPYYTVTDKRGRFPFSKSDLTFGSKEPRVDSVRVKSWQKASRHEHVADNASLGAHSMLSLPSAL